MTRSNIKQKLIDRDYFRRPGLYTNYDEMVRAIPFRATTDYYQTQHSEFEKPYLDQNYNYERMQHIWPRTWRIPYLNLRDYQTPISSTSVGPPGASPCGDVREFNGTVDGEAIDGWYELSCGETVHIGITGGIAEAEVAFVGGSGNGTLNGDVYTAGPCECCEETFDNIIIADECGNVSNVIIKTICDKDAPNIVITSDMITDPESSSHALIGNGDNFYVTGGTAPYTWSIDCGSLEVSADTTQATWTDASCCGPGIVTVQDECGSQGSMGFRYPDGVWGSLYTEIDYCLSPGASYYEVYSGSARRRYHWGTCGFSSCTWGSCAEAKSSPCSFGGCGPELCDSPYLPPGTCFTLTSSCGDDPCNSSNCFERCAWLKIIQRQDWECP